MGTLEVLVYTSLIEHEETLQYLTLGACQTFVTDPGSVTGCDTLSSHMAMRALIQVEDAYELIFYSICNCMCFYRKSHTATLYCLTCICLCILIVGFIHLLIQTDQKVTF